MSDSPLVFIVDDELLVRQALSSLLRSVGYHVKTYGLTEDAYADPDLGRADCLVLDIRLPLTSGLDFQRKLNERGIAIPIIFVTGHGDIPMSVKAMKAGARDFLAKPIRDQDVLDAVQAAVKQSQIARSAEKRIQELRSRYQTLSAREKQIMAMATSGLMNKQIAGELELSEITVKIHRGKVSRKMMAKTFADLVKMAELLGVSAAGSHSE